MRLLLLLILYNEYNITKFKVGGKVGGLFVHELLKRSVYY